MIPVPLLIHSDIEIPNQEVSVCETFFVVVPYIFIADSTLKYFLFFLFVLFNFSNSDDEICTPMPNDRDTYAEIILEQPSDFGNKADRPSGACHVFL